ncbi:MAG: ABC transporter permease subunit [Acidimicrobiales bacterium]
MTFTVLGLHVNQPLLVLGAITGMTYGILAVGLVLVYRSSRVINFAHGEIGALGAAMCAVLVVRWHMPYWVGMIAALALSAAVGAGTEVVVIRRLKKAPKLMSLVATVGIAQFLLLFSTALNSKISSSSSFLQPAGMPQFRVGALLVTPAYSTMLIVTPLLVAALVVFLNRSRFGLALRAAASDPERARVVAISPSRMSALSWAIAGAIAAYTALLIVPTRGFINAEALGPELLLRALAAGAIGRMESLPIALGAGLAIGVTDQVLSYNYPTSGAPEAVLLVVIVGALVFQRRREGRREGREDWAALQPWPSLPSELRRIAAIRNLRPAVAAVALVAAVAAGVLSSNTKAVALVAVVAFALIGLSFGIVTGLGGQLSLGQFALAGVGATTSYLVAHQTGNFVLGLLAAGLAAGAASVFLGLPALRVRGLMLAVITLSFALSAPRSLFGQRWALGGGVSTGRPKLGGVVLGQNRSYYFWALGVLVIGFWLAANVWRGGLGLRLRAVRDNEDGARAFAVSPTAVKLHGFVVAGVLAGFAGAVYGHLLPSISADSFDVATSINVVALTVVGGIGLLAGPLIGALYIIALPRYVPLDSAGLAATSLGWLMLIVYFPGGIAQLIAGPRRRLIHLLARRAGVDPLAVEALPDPSSEGFAGHSITFGRDRRPPDHAADEPLLEADRLAKSYGGIVAVDTISLEVAHGEILGLIGPNGAGKTTLFELLSGFVVPDTGTIRFCGEDVTDLSPSTRARRGLIRSFQDAALFPTLTVLESVTLAFERTSPTNFLQTVVGLHANERWKTTHARELVSFMGLDRYCDRQIRELSTGTRRITELACMVGLDPTVILLDEPSSGIAQRESEALGTVLRQIKEHLGCTLLVIEHDVPLLMGLSSRVMAMDAGRVIALGTPEEVQHHPAVVESYLGRDLAATARSGRVAPGSGTRCDGTTRSGSRCVRRAGSDGLCGIHRRVLERSS